MGFASQKQLSTASYVAYFDCCSDPHVYTRLICWQQRVLRRRKAERIFAERCIMMHSLEAVTGEKAFLQTY